MQKVTHAAREDIAGDQEQMEREKVVRLIPVMTLLAVTFFGQSAETMTLQNSRTERLS